ncbi:hypothetical protein [Streptomyces sp. NPDC017260]|uniref:hypothetical protein n=1 Tax=unclassified Streptomyces TaxID=2593676 RepID=UPI0037BB6534
MAPIETAEAPALFRGMLRDIVACDDYAEVCRLLDLVPAGPDVDEIEHRQSHYRLEEFHQVSDEALSHADVAAEVLYRLTHINQCAPSCEDDQQRQMFHLVSRTAVTTVVAHLLEKGHLGVA